MIMSFLFSETFCHEYVIASYIQHTRIGKSLPEQLRFLSAYSNRSMSQKNERETSDNTYKFD